MTRATGSSCSCSSMGEGSRDPGVRVQVVVVRCCLLLLLLLVMVVVRVWMRLLLVMMMLVVVGVHRQSPSGCHAGCRDGSSVRREAVHLQRLGQDVRLLPLASVRQIEGRLEGKEGEGVRSPGVHRQREE